ncbi:tubulin binding cofactor A-domain-containing protein [Sparassis latifolia]|uniref:Tubulin-specific chaperone A n=1 Tax=Sparassis crispa TaxID=139825 RepID=A0A401G5N1_9APHY|nr:tubulin binding cofactor A [Sparassis crispa]GBE77476.1 tubulin binding cofactor A [Sparassis crispa]
MAEVAALRRQLKIKNGVCKRLWKEHKSYQTEEVQQRIKVDKFKAVGAEDWDIKNGTRMLEESQKMVKDTANRLGVALQELRELIVTAEKIPDMGNSEELVQAQAIFEEVST